ncbi:MAG: LysR family transcriptional regulator [Hyphomonas sp.]|uniref:LysR family transcriptional regulator n=1 Tax=Hyphomonas sp. TaxID=87 RepID=UPI00179A5E50|nr:LysR family transcriptional regulator [Hyphomonas sp.]MBU3922347.1 LysR family transcriptional regulator [Alphaproteobacteria bacterium]MBA3069524.1 LysR family transcriptional regulator [Hyphomonas sp.]MBU4063315.1 LysR family transcriptional regulator [Alphaproteobacteria bacterium]MBU4164133.1 LysR family transcriptional regulator [Alphaproteobacteria bacterium]MBU4568576.1 LysR family transcriptional regulator [Alphaproteobacteria bacterium]
MVDRIDAMRLFIRVADAGSFSRAASDLELGQPTVSRRVQDLEESLGTTLFLRTTRALSLTEAGTRFYRRAADILAEYDEAEAEARGFEHSPVGLLRLSCSHSFGRRVIAPMLPGFLAAWPNIRVDLISDDALTDLVADGVDIAFRLGEMRDSSLMAKKLGEASQVIWASQAYIDRRGAPQHPSELAGHDALVFRHIRQTTWELRSGTETFEARVDGPFRASSGETLLEAAAGGLGLFLAPAWLASECTGEIRLVRVLPDWMGPSLSIHAVWSSGKLRGKAKLFIDHAEPSIAAACGLSRLQTAHR